MMITRITTALHKIKNPLPKKWANYQLFHYQLSINNDSDQPEQSAYLGLPKEGPFKVDHYRY